MATDTVAHLGVELGYRFFTKMLEESEEARALHERLTHDGLKPQPERSHLFNLYSPDSCKAVAVSITPYVSEDLQREAGLSVSEGGHAQAVVVSLEDKVRLSSFTHLALADGEVNASDHKVAELGDQYAGERAVEQVRQYAESAGKIKAARPLVEVDARQVRSLASVSYNALLGDNFAGTVHDERELSELRASTDLVAQIGLFVLFRTEGSSCCSCSCSCWGSSSCSSSYIG